MNCKIYLSIIVLGLTLYSCKKDESDIEPIYLQRNPTSYVLKKQNWQHPNATNGQTRLYFYNKQHLISEIQQIQWGTYTVDNGPLQTWFDTAYCYFEYDGYRLNKSVQKIAGGQWYYLYDYENNLMVKRTTFNSTNTVTKVTLYHYNSDGKLVETIDSTDKVYFKYIREYEGENLKSITEYNLAASPQQKSKYEYANFDNKIHFLRTVNGLPISEWDNNFYSNFRTEKYYQLLPMEQPFGPAIITPYTYFYNSEGLPTSMKYAGWTVSFEYEKYK